jgi:hypothetical protein
MRRSIEIIINGLDHKKEPPAVVVGLLTMKRTLPDQQIQQEILLRCWEDALQIPNDAGSGFFYYVIKTLGRSG